MSPAERAVTVACKWAHFALSAAMAAWALWEPGLFLSLVDAAFAWANLARFNYLNRLLRGAT